MEGLGWTYPDPTQSEAAFCNERRSHWITDWYFIAYLIENECDEDHLWPNDDAIGWAHLFGPSYTQLRVVPSMETTARHEVGHIFGAWDEREDSSPSLCNQPVGFLGVNNGNHFDCGNQVTCIMGDGAVGVCQFTAGQIGWRDSDGDGALDPLDPMTGLTATLGPVSLGDRVDIYTLNLGFVRSLIAGRTNTVRVSSNRYLLWGGKNTNFSTVAPGGYTSNLGSFGLGPDLTGPVLESVVVTPGTIQPYGLDLTLSFELDDTSTDGCFANALITATNDPEFSVYHFRNQMFSTHYDRTYFSSPVPIETCDSFEYELFVWDVGGNHNAVVATPFQSCTPAGVVENVLIPRLRLTSGTPNPFRSSVSWTVEADRDMRCDIAILDVKGSLVTSWSDRYVPSGRTSILWNGTNYQGQRVSSGKYFLKIVGNSDVAVVSSVVVIR